MSSKSDIAGKRSERGSALLIVFVFAAVIAIMLYREMPVSAFEAQRQKEQLLIDRGQEYKRAVKLYYIKLGSYPSSIDQLESTNRMRFLRHRFKDPFTGKDDWRLLHMGPGGMLLDSKVNPLKTGDQNGTSFAGNNTGAGGSSSTTFGANTNMNQQTAQPPVSLGQPTAYMTPGMPVVYHNYPGGIQGGPAVPVAGRAPAIPANGGQQRNEDGPDPSLNDSDSGAITSQNGTIEAGISQNSGAAQNIAQQNGQGPGLNAQNGMNMLGPGSAAAQQSGAATSPNMPQRVSPAMMAVQNLLQQGNQPANTSSNSSSTFGSTPNAGRLNNGGLAGVASKIEGRGIKVVEDQSDYSKWEFYYDPRKDTVAVMNMSNSGGVQMMNDPNHANGPFNVPPVNTTGQVPTNANGGTTSNGTSFGPSVFGPPIPAQGQMPVPIQTIPPQQQLQQQQQQSQPQQDQQQEQQQQ